MANSSVCFFPNSNTDGGDINPIFVPCDPAASVSACCAVGESCTGSGLCYSSSGGIYRGACTDKTWKDASCPHLCNEDNTGRNSGSQDGFQFLINCEGNTFVCGDRTECDNSTFTFPHNVGPIMQVNITGNFNQSQLISSIPSSSPSNSSSGDSVAHRCSSHSTTTVGVALGVALGVLLLSAIAWGLWERRGRTRLLRGNVGAGAGFATGHEYVYKQTPLAEVGDQRPVLEMPGR
ncbi:hypothetical protein BU16DRAFT_97392 [Lophium mytilinum]|uniref:Mid2 domain-containing protein n=1 Tax=Lophium mytilinum TaxID=390894 RepID=A0A6A6QMV6_9PEZI|nr:hypothetical protein BU16DRAFT_97392 [Lophium mytilinum]